MAARRVLADGKVVSVTKRSIEKLKKPSPGVVTWSDCVSRYSFTLLIAVSRPVPLWLTVIFESTPVKPSVHIWSFMTPTLSRPWFT